MKIVKFKDGTYGIRKLTIIGYQFLDIEKADYWWFNKEYVNTKCKGTLEQTKEAMKKHKEVIDNGKMIKRWR